MTNKTFRSVERVNVEQAIAKIGGVRALLMCEHCLKQAKKACNADVLIGINNSLKTDEYHIIGICHD